MTGRENVKKKKKERVRKNVRIDTGNERQKIKRRICKLSVER